MRYLCIIPVRQGSKGIPEKNIRELGGKPLMAWTIEQAVQCDTIDRVVVSTDSAHYAELARRFGAETPFLRPAELATDETATEPVLLHAIDALATDGYEADAVVLLQATTPFRQPDTIDAAIRQFESAQADSLLTVAETTPLLWRNAAAPEALYDFQNRPRRQDIAPDAQVFRENGSIFISKCDLLRHTGNRLGGKITMFQVSGAEALDIDSPEDFQQAEFFSRSWHSA